MKCDLHVHSQHSGMCSTPLVGRICRESYSAPDRIYATLKKRGMDLVTLTDHDSIGAAESLRHRADFFISEEVTCVMPSGSIAHIGIYDITDRQHAEIQRRRNDLGALLAYITERRLLFTVQHMFSALTGRRHREDFPLFEEYFPAVETRSGQMLPAHNRYAESFAKHWRKAGLGGSDSHALPSAGTAYTEVAHARNKAEFFEGIRAGEAVAAGGHGGYFKLTRDIFCITAGMMRERPWTALLAPLTLLLPAATFAILAQEMAFAWYWNRQVGAPYREKPRRESRDDWFRGVPTRPEEVPIWP